MAENWFASGYDGIEKEQERLDQQYGPSRFWLKSGASCDIAFVDDDPVCVYEHNPKIAGDFKNWLTCVQGVYDEVVCCQKLGPDSRYYCGYLTVVDCSKWVDNRGTEHQYELKLLPAKMKTLKKFRRKKEDRGKLSGSLYTATREDDRSPNVGDEFEFKRDVDMAKLFEVANYKGRSLTELYDEAEKNEKAMATLRRLFKIAEKDGKLLRSVMPVFNYMKVLEPKTPKDLRIMLGAYTPEDGGGKGGGARGGSGGKSREEDVPF